MSTPSAPDMPEKPHAQGAIARGHDGQHDGFPHNVEEARTDLELTRRELGETAGELAYRLNISDRAKEEFQSRSQIVLTFMRSNPEFVSAAGAAVILIIGGVLTWRMKR